MPTQAACPSTSTAFLQDLITADRMLLHYLNNYLQPSDTLHTQLLESLPALCSASRPCTCGPGPLASLGWIWDGIFQRHVQHLQARATGSTCNVQQHCNLARKQSKEK
jgi:hypothetical protein